MMTCEQIEELLMPYLLDELDEHRDADVYIHLRGCDACRGAAKEMESTVNLLQDAFELDIDAPVALTDAQKENVRGSVSVEEKPRSGTIISWIKDQHVSIQTIAAVLVLCAVLTIAIPMGRVGGLSEADFASDKSGKTPTDQDGLLDIFTMGNKVSEDAPSMTADEIGDTLSKGAAMPGQSRWKDVAAGDDDKRKLIEEGKRLIAEKSLVEATEIRLGSIDHMETLTDAPSTVIRREVVMDEVSVPLESANEAIVDTAGWTATAHRESNLPTDRGRREKDRKPAPKGGPAPVVLEPGENGQVDSRYVGEINGAYKVEEKHTLSDPASGKATYWNGRDVADVPGAGGQGSGTLSPGDYSRIVPVTPTKKKLNQSKDDELYVSKNVSVDNVVRDEEDAITFGANGDGYSDFSREESRRQNAAGEDGLKRLQDVHPEKQKMPESLRVVDKRQVEETGLKALREGRNDGSVVNDMKHEEAESGFYAERLDVSVVGGKDFDGLDYNAPAPVVSTVPVALPEPEPVPVPKPTPARAPAPPKVERELSNDTAWYVQDLSNERGLGGDDGKKGDKETLPTTRSLPAQKAEGFTSANQKAKTLHVDRDASDVGGSYEVANEVNEKKTSKEARKSREGGGIPLIGRLFSTSKSRQSMSVPMNAPAPVETESVSNFELPMEEVEEAAEVEVSSGEKLKPVTATLSAGRATAPGGDKDGDETAQTTYRYDDSGAIGGMLKDGQEMPDVNFTESDDDQSQLAAQTVSEVNGTIVHSQNVVGFQVTDDLDGDGVPAFVSSDIVPDTTEDYKGQENDKISMNFEDAPLSMVVNTFTKWSGANIIATPEGLEGTVTVNLEDVEWEAGLQAVLKESNYTLTENTSGSGVYSIVPMTSETSPVGFNYTVAEGDTLSHIAEQYKVPVSEIVKANNIQNANSIRVNQVIVIPQQEEVKENVAELPEIKKAVDPESAAFKAFGVNPFIYSAANAFSTFSIDVDTASYTRSRNYMLRGFLPTAESVRTEEFVNFFDYAYTAPQHATFQVHAEVAPTPFGRGLHALKIGVKGRHLGREEQKPAMLTFAIDTSGSMNTADRLGLVQKSLAMLLEKLGPQDQVCIVQYNDQARLLLEHTSANEKEKILAAVNNLKTTGSTNLEKGVSLAYEMAAKGFKSGAVNRVLLLSDGVANLGADESQQILDKVATLRKQGIFCSVFGFGIGNYDDNMLETLADKGDGSYVFVDSLEEAQRVFVDDLSATLNTIASDVKIQVEFNPDMVKRYRQLGYENRQLTKEQFRDDTVDAGEVGSGQAVTALYELELQDEHARIGTVRVRYRDVETGKIVETATDLTARMIHDRFEDADARFRLAAGVAEFSEILRGSPHAKGSTYAEVGKVLRPVALELHLDKQVQELSRMVQGANSMSRAAE